MGDLLLVVAFFAAFMGLVALYGIADEKTGGKLGEYTGAFTAVMVVAVLAWIFLGGLAAS